MIRRVAGSYRDSSHHITHCAGLAEPVQFDEVLHFPRSTPALEIVDVNRSMVWRDMGYTLTVSLRISRVASWMRSSMLVSTTRSRPANDVIFSFSFLMSFLFRG